MKIESAKLAWPEYCNSDLPSSHFKSKDMYRKYVNFLDVASTLDFQLGYVKYHSKPQISMHRHRHSTSTEIVYVLHGNQTFCVDGIDYHLGGGDILLSPPRLPHGDEKTNEEKGDFYYLNINPDALSDILPQTCDEDRQILTKILLTAPVQVHCSDSKRMRELSDALLHLYADTCAFKPTRIRNVLCELLLLTADVVEEKRLEESFSPFMQEVYLYIEDHLTENLSVDALAAHFGYSHTAFRNKFKVYAHRTVHEYILHRKIERAKMMLADKESDTKKIWQALSFSTSSYFHQVFKRYTGMTVSQYRESIK